MMRRVWNERKYAGFFYKHGLAYCGDGVGSVGVLKD
jgi:hypothetical protein